MPEITLKPLPEPFVSAVAVTYALGGNIKEPVYTASQVEQIRRDAARNALVAAAEACATAGEAAADMHGTGAECLQTAELCADAIRALMPKDAAERVAAAGGSGLPGLLEKFDGVPDQSGRVVGVMPKEEGK
jgi:hypothetical protein